MSNQKQSTRTIRVNRKNGIQGAKHMEVFGLNAENAEFISLWRFLCSLGVIHSARSTYPRRKQFVCALNSMTGYKEKQCEYLEAWVKTDMNHQPYTEILKDGLAPISVVVHIAHGTTDHENLCAKLTWLASNGEEAEDKVCCLLESDIPKGLTENDVIQASDDAGSRKFDREEDLSILRSLIDEMDELEPSETEKRECWTLDVRRIRKQASVDMTQREFAVRFGLGLKNIQKWEQGATKPSEGIRTLLWLIDKYPKEIQRLLNGDE